jgi:hypothetical protein
MNSRHTWQLSLFPHRGFGLLLDGSELAVDHATGLPVIRATRRAIGRVRLPEWLAPLAQPVRIEIHNESDDEGRPCYVVGDRP